MLLEDHRKSHKKGENINTDKCQKSANRVLGKNMIPLFLHKSGYLYMIRGLLNKKMANWTFLPKLS